MPFIAPGRPAIAPRHLPMLIDGEFVDGGGRDIITRDSPAHGLPVSSCPAATRDDLDRAVAAARRAFDAGPWPRLHAADRSAVLMRVADLIERDAEELAMLDTLEAGKPIRQTRTEMRDSASWWRYAAGQARSLHGESYNNLGPKALAMLLRDPVGVVGMITAWNFPFPLISQKLPFALAAGCTVVVKPSEMTSGSTLHLGRLLVEAGLPAGVVNILAGDGPSVGQPLAEHPGTDMTSFTGSTAVGRKVIEASARNIKKVGLELGGKNGMIVCEDARLDEAADALAFGLLLNTGQCCQSSSRVYVHEDIHDAFMSKVAAAVERVTFGDPLDERVMVGAIVSERQLDRIASYVDEAAAAGCRVETGGKRLSANEGLFFPPTVFSGVSHDSRIAREEVFGPVLSAIPFRDLDDALAMLNDTRYGLAAGIWTQDAGRGIRAVRAMRAGVVWLNAWMEGYPELPFGGYGESGLGREGGRIGIEEYTEIKTLLLNSGPRSEWWAGAPEGK